MTHAYRMLHQANLHNATTVFYDWVKFVTCNIRDFYILFKSPRALITLCNALFHQSNLHAFNLCDWVKLVTCAISHILISCLKIYYCCWPDLYTQVYAMACRITLISTFCVETYYIIFFWCYENWSCVPYPRFSLFWKSTTVDVNIYYIRIYTISSCITLICAILKPYIYIYMLWLVKNLSLV